MTTRPTTRFRRSTHKENNVSSTDSETETLEEQDKAAGADNASDSKDKGVDYWKSRAARAEADAGLSSVITDKTQRAELVKTLFDGAAPDSVSAKVDKLVVAFSSVGKGASKPPPKQKPGEQGQDESDNEDAELNTLFDSMLEERLGAVVDKLLGQKLAPLGAKIGETVKSASKITQEEKAKQAKASRAKAVKNHLKMLLSKRGITQRTSK